MMGGWWCAEGMGALHVCTDVQACICICTWAHICMHVRVHFTGISSPKQWEKSWLPWNTQLSSLQSSVAADAFAVWDLGQYLCSWTLKAASETLVWEVQRSKIQRWSSNLLVPSALQICNASVHTNPCLPWTFLSFFIEACWRDLNLFMADPSVREHPQWGSGVSRACCWSGPVAPAISFFLSFGSRLEFQGGEDLMGLPWVTGPLQGLWEYQAYAVL